MVSLVPGLRVIILTYYPVYFCEYVRWYGLNIHHHKILATHPFVRCRGRQLFIRLPDFWERNQVHHTRANASF